MAKPRLKYLEYDLERKCQNNVKMVINITNKQILSFFEQHPSLDPENNEICIEME